ncbi:hypothetical protein TVAG_149500 [Trichomonas vaginalis G3]|uniref:Uncharacterized protein n=2 Tax=Trichomonas vaginalis (strain ATCC PRA-98 / G3) TaxID=412133 RepID=A2ELL7_TRIV3|nr:hypothetical protein TVAG_149500 [Trichomonas vaginalis G3]|eukprot:XP_001318687.1 hypothetical protein [Trichomonas vaginalis G3]
MIDVVNNCIDINGFFDYLKNTYKKEIIIINAAAFAEKETSRPAKTDAKLSNRSKHDPNETIIKGLKNKLDSELQKVNEQIKKQVAAESKGKDPKHSRSKSRSKSSLGNTDTPQTFQGQIDVLIIILNYPYFKDQLQLMMKSHMSHCAFIALIPENEKPQPKSYEYHQLEKASKSDKTKKVTIPGLELDYTNNPDCYPPARWQSLELTANDVVPFTEVKVGADFESTFKNLESEIVLISKSRHHYVEDVKNKLKEIPLATNRVDIEDFKTYTFANQGQYLNGLYYELSLHNFNVIEPMPPLSQGDLMAQLFKKNRAEVSRAVAYNQTPPPDDIFFENKNSPYICTVFGDLMKWKPTEEVTVATSAIMPFLIKPSNFHAYAGQKFDQMVSNMNKKYVLNLPAAYFDWSQWTLYADYPSITEFIEEHLKSVLLIERDMEKETGMMWVMALEPIARTIGTVIRQDYMPPMMKGMTDYMKEIYDKESQENEQKKKPLSTKKQTPAQILKNGGNPKDLLKTFYEQIKDKDTIYRLPINLMNNTKFSTPYFFKNGMRVRIDRDVTEEKTKISATVYYKDEFKIYITEDSVTLNTVEDVRLTIDSKGSISLIFLEESILYDGKDVLSKGTNEKTIAIAGDGSLIVDQGKVKRIVMPNGTIATYNGVNWLYVDNKGEAFTKQNGVETPLNLPHSYVIDADKKVTKQIRPDNIEYYVDGNGFRRILINMELDVGQNEEEIYYEIPNLPVIKYSKTGGFIIVIDRYTITFNGAQSSFTSDSYSFNINKEIVSVTIPGGEMELSSKKMQFKCDNNVLIATDDGIESVCEIATEIKKKATFYETKWGNAVPIKENLLEPNHIELHNLYRPKFFVVYNDLSVTEFFREDAVLNDKDFTIKKESSSHPSGESINVITLHSLVDNPQVYVQVESVNKMQRSAIMKGLVLPKKNQKQSNKKKKEEENQGTDLELAEGTTYEFAYNKKIFIDSLQSILTRAHRIFEMENTHEEEEEMRLEVQPVCTPPPRVLKAQQLVNEPRLGAQELNFWKTHESDFAFPAEFKYPPPKPVSPRVKLNDPPRFFDGKATDVPKV